MLFPDQGVAVMTNGDEKVTMPIEKISVDLAAALASRGAVNKYRHIQLYFFDCCGDDYMTGTIVVLAGSLEAARQVMIDTAKAAAMTPTARCDLAKRACLYVYDNNVFLTPPATETPREGYSHYWLYDPAKSLDVTVPAGTPDCVWASCVRVV